MKKPVLIGLIAFGIIIFLTIAIIIFIWGINFISNTIINPPQEEKSPLFTYQEMSIKLTTDFEETRATSSNVEYRSDKHRVNIIRMDFSNITPHEGYAFPSLYEFMEDYITLFIDYEPEEIIFTEHNGILYYDADKNGDGSIDSLFAMYESENAFWLVEFSPLNNNNYGESRHLFMMWAQTISFTEKNQ